MQKSKENQREVYLDYSASWGPNPSSIHKWGTEAKKKIQKSRTKVAEILKARPEEIIFTHSGTESNNLAIQGLVFAFANKFKKQFPHIITTNIEHPSVLETFQILKERGMAEISVVPVEKNGIVDPSAIKKEIKTNTVLVSVMYANNEIGTIQPIYEIAKTIRHYKKNNQRDDIFFHTDATQAVGYLEVNTEKLGVDMLSFSSAKISKARGVGILFKKKLVPLLPIMGGGDQEFGLSPGTENLAGIEQFARDFSVLSLGKEKEAERLRKLRDYFLGKLTKLSLKLDIKMYVNGDMISRLPNNLNVTFGKIPSELLVIELSSKGIMTSAKSACKSESSEGSYVISALENGVPKEIGGLRFSFGNDTKKESVDHALDAMSSILSKYKKWYN